MQLVNLILTIFQVQATSTMPSPKGGHPLTGYIFFVAIPLLYFGIKGYHKIRPPNKKPKSDTKN